MTTESETPVYIQAGDAPYEGAVFDPALGPPNFAVLQDPASRLIRRAYRQDSYGGAEGWPQRLANQLHPSAAGLVIEAFYPTHSSWAALPGQYGSASGKYLGYDSGVYDDPVNQIPHVREWMKHISTFAHEIDTLWSEHSISLRKEDNYNMVPGSAIRDTEINLRNQTALRYGRAICGYAFEKVERWATLNPRETAWRTQMPGVLEDVEALCLICDHTHWLRQFLYRHDMLPWVNALNEVHTVPNIGTYMRVPKIDKSTTPWQPSTENITTISWQCPA